MNIYYPLLKMFWFGVRHKDRIKTVPLSLPDGIEEVKDVDYFGDGKSEHMLDIYFRGKGESPVVLSIHGGGWMSGVKENNRNFCIRLAERGFTVFNVNYSLAPKASLRDQLCDITAALSFLKENAGSFSGAPGSVSLIGDSAGGQLAFFTAALLCSGRLREIYGINLPDIKVRTLALLSPVCFLTEGRGPVASGRRIALSRDFMKKYGQYVSPDSLPDLGSLPPCFISTAAEDHLGREQSRRLSELLQKNGVRCELHFEERSAHGHVYPIHNPDCDAAVSVTDSIARLIENA